jgi:L-fucose mutarotase/ribose pyranase (RbsD/FucU family)
MAENTLKYTVDVDGQPLKDVIEQIKKMRDELDKATDEKAIETLNKNLKQTEDAVKDVNEAVKDFGLGKKFEDVYGELQPLSSRLGELEDRMYELAFAGKAGTEEFQALRSEAANMRQTIIDVDKQVDLLADNKGFSIFGAGISGIGDSLMRLDFAGAEREATGLAKAATKITFKDALQSVKQLGKTFLTVGKAILTNPLFLIAAVVAAVVAAIVKLMDELGLLEVVFKAIGDAVGFVIQMLKDMLDWLGLTSYAEEDAAARTAAAQEQIAESYAKKRDAVVDSYDHEIRMAKIAGKDTTELERQKQYAIIQTSEAQAEALKAQIISMRAAGTLTAEKAKEIRAAMAELKKGVSEAKQELQAINAQEVADNNAANEKKAADNKAAAEKRKAAAKQEAADRLAAARMIEDAEMQLRKSGIEKERLENEVRYRRLIEDTNANTKLLADEKAALVLSLQEQEFEARKAIEQKYLDESNAAIKLADEERVKTAKETEEKINAQKKAAAEGSAQITKDLFAAEIAARENMQTAMLGIAEGTVQLLGSVAGKSKALQISALAIEKGAAIANVVINAMKEMSGNAAAAALNPLNAATFGAAGAAQLLKSNIFTKIRAGLAIATIASTSISGARSIATSGGGASAGGGGGGAAASGSSTPNVGMGQSQQMQTPQMNLNNGQTQTAQSTNKERVFVVDYMDIQDKGNELQMSQQKVILA